MKSKRKDVILIEEMRIYILNTTRFYHEDFEEYPGAWFSCPVDFEEIRERLGVQSEEEIEIEDYAAAVSIGGQHKALGNQRPLPDDTGNAGNAPLL